MSTEKMHDTSHMKPKGHDRHDIYDRHDMRHGDRHIGVAASVMRMSGFVLRHWYLLSSSLPRILDLIYWPTVQLTMWGIMQGYLINEGGFVALSGGVLLGSVMLWDVLFRGQIGFGICFLEEFYSRNIGNLTVSPLRPWEFIGALMCISVIRTLIGIVPVTLLAIVWFGFNIYSLGIWLVVFFVNLIVTGWALGLFMCGLLFRFGLGAENLVWSVTFMFMPLCCVYYPLEAMPTWLQPVSLSLAPTYVYEGMRAIIIDGVVKENLMIRAIGLNCLYMAIGTLAFLFFYRDAKKRGSLVSIGE